MKKYILEIVIFLSGAVVMVFELVGSRILAPYLGASLVIWTSLIGVILGSLSLGYYVGGKFSDKNSNYFNLAVIVFLSAILVTFTVVIKEQFLEFLGGVPRDVRLTGVFASLILFAPASVLFGMIPPYVIRLKLKVIENSGETIGLMYAISTIGSIFGTFFAGFYLIPTIGSTKILILISFVLLVVSSLLYFYSSVKIKTKEFLLFFIMILVVFLNYYLSSIPNKDYLEISTLYNDIRIVEKIDKETKRPVRAYSTNPYGDQSAIFLDKNDDLVFDVYRFYRLSNFFNPVNEKALMIGGGAYTYVKDFLRENETATIDVVEIDSDLLEIAKKYFDYEENERAKIYHEDGRTFINNMKGKYDLVIIDAFNTHLSPPFYLTTQEVAQKIYSALNENGIVMLNLMSALEGEHAKFLRAELATYESVFPKTYVFPIYYTNKPEKSQNILVVATKNGIEIDFEKTDKKFDKYLSHRWTGGVKKDLPILTDEFSPVESYIVDLF